MRCTGGENGACARAAAFPGGNIRSEEREGIRVHVYGAHISHTNSREVWQYVNAPIANFRGELYHLPFNMNTFHAMWGVTTPAQAAERIAAQRAEIAGEPQNLEEQAISLVGWDIYEKLIKGYTEKQWGRSCRDLPAFIIKRLPVRYTYDNNYFNARCTRYYQAMIDMDVLNRGEFYTKLRRTFIIFVCTFDPFGYDRSVYTFKETCQEDKHILMGDETTKLFLNSKGSREGVRKDLAAFLDYVEGEAPEGSFARDLAKEVESAKENKEMKVEYMTFNMELRRREELGRTEGREEGRAEGRAEGIRSILKQLVKEGALTVEAAAEKMGVTAEEFCKLSMQ